MTNTSAEVLSLALQLPQAERAMVAQELLLSLEHEPFDDGVAEAWQAEIERRAHDHENGKSEAIEWRQAIADLRKSLSKQTPS